MEFEIRNSNGQCMYYTEYKSCIPVEHLDSMSSVGLSFYLDGKKISVSSLKQQFKGAKKPGHSKDDTTSSDEKTIDFSKLDFPVTSRTVVCMTTGKVYKNQSEAARDLKFDPACISDCVCKGKTYKGYTFKRAVDLQ